MSSQRQSLQQKKSSISFLFWIFLLFSFPVVILVVGYAAGFRYNPTANQLTASAGISVDTVPNDAVVRLNGTDLKEKTPVVETISPGYYTIEISKEGYALWSKEMAVSENQSILFPEIYLFLDDVEPTEIAADMLPPEKLESLLPLPESTASYFTSTSSNDVLYSDGPADIVIKPNNESIAITSSIQDIVNESDITEYDIQAEIVEWNRQSAVIANDKEIWVYDNRYGSIDILLRQSNTISDIEWHPSGEYIIYADTKGIHVFELDSRSGTAQKWTLVHAPDAINLHISSNEKDLYYSIGQSHYKRQLQDYSIFSK